MWANIKYTLLFWWMAFFLRFAYITRLRQFWNKFCQWRFDSKDGWLQLPKLDTPGEIWPFLGPKFKYVKDPVGGILDYFSEPEKFYWRVINKEDQHGDCDDVARFVAALLFPMKGIKTVYVLHTGYPGGGHATVVFKQHEQWFHFDYGLRKINEPNEAIQQVVDRYANPGQEKKACYWCFESYGMHPVAICPKKVNVAPLFKDYTYKNP